MELQEIIARIAEGDTQAFGRLVSRYRDMAFGYALSLLDQEQMAEDAVQEALVVAYTNLDRLQEPQAFGAWLRGIVRHQCYRAQRRRSPTVSWEQMEEIGGEADDPAREAEVLVVREQVHAAIAALQPAQREVVLLAYEAGLSQPKIAARLSLTVGAVNMRLHAARTRLRRRLLTMTDTPSQLPNSGRVQEADGPLVTAQFAPKATPPLFSLLAAGDKDRLCVVQHLNAGRVRALSARPETLWTPGQEILDTGRPYTEVLDRTAVQRAVEKLRPVSAGVGPLESGIKTIEVFAPLTQGGSAGIFTEWGLGVLVLLPELLQHLDRGENRQALFVFLPPMQDAQQWQEVTAEITTGSRNVPIVYLPVADPISPEFVQAIPGLDATLILSRRLAEQAIWPCLDPLRCRSRRLDGNAARKELAGGVRALLQRYYTLQFSLEDVALHALSPEERQAIQRARRALWFLSQPFFVAEPYTQKPGVFVSSEEAVRGFADILAGRYDAAPQGAFTMVGAAPAGGPAGTRSNDAAPDNRI